MRALIARKTRESLTQTAMVTYEKRVLPPNWLGNAVKFRTSEQEYRYPNGSIIALGGLDKPTKIMSSEYDIVYVAEATELLEDDWEALTTRLRNHVMPYQQLLADCNPGPPTHWLKQRADRGATLLLESRHEDNPSVTPEYLATLDALTGVRKLRLRYGKWAAAEGMVYEDWNPAVHVVSRKRLQEWGVLTEGLAINREVIKRVLASVDWGYSNPGVIQVYGIDGDDRAYLLREYYQTGKTVDSYWVPLAKRLKQEHGITHFICDPSEPAYIEQFNKAGLNAIKATNAIAPGINNVQARLKLAGDSRPRLFVYEYALQERDEKREAAHEPFCLQMEIDAYSWPVSKNGAPVKEVPVKVNDHAMDALRYMCQYLAEPKKGGGILIAMMDEEETPENAPPQIEQPLYATDWHNLFNDDSHLHW
jgi:phage terminase large subunit